jgi:small-conductance mechanosensitive channel
MRHEAGGDEHALHGTQRLAVSGQLGLRGGLRRLSTGLIAYGAAGLAVALLGLVALAWTAGRVSSLADRVDAEVGQLATTLDRTAETLQSAGVSAVTFAVTLERTPPSVRQAAETIRNLRPNLQAIEAQLASISILGNQPLAGPARLFGEMARDLAGLDTRLDLIADDLVTDRDALLRNADSLEALGARTTLLADRIRTGFIQDGLDDLRAVLLMTILVFVGWTAVPAIGALALGVWLRRTLGVDPSLGE